VAVRDEFEAVAHELFDTWYRFKPVQASWLGIHAYDDQLSDLSAGGIEGQSTVFHEQLDRLAALPTAELPSELAVDHRVATAIVQEELWSLERAMWWQRNPTAYVQEPLFGLLALVTRDYAPIEQRAASALSRLQQLPDTLHAGRVNVSSPPRVYVETAIQSARGGAAFVRDAVPRLAERARDLRQELLREGERGAAAFDEYAEMLSDEMMPVAHERFAIGRELFEERLREWHMLDLPADELAGVGRRLFESTLGRLQEFAAELAPGREWPDLVEEARRDHPSADGLLDAYREELTRLRAFMLERDLVTVPTGDRLEVVPTPAFERAVVPYAAYMPPAPFEPAQQGEFWVTPIDTTAPPERQEAQLGEHCYGSFPITALHEGFPGHHLQLVVANAHPSFVRKHMASELFAEGWAFYCEQLMGEQGYYHDPRLRLFQLKDQLWRTARIVIDAGLHTGSMTFEDAVTLLVDGAHLARAQAEGEVRRYCATPTQPMTYAMGKEQILALRSELGDLALREFHDRLLASGTLPFALIREEMLARG
jgi:uncharacterized protein (DUF885 family)